MLSGMSVRKARELRRSVLLEYLLKGVVSNYELSRILHVSTRTVNRDRRAINGYLSNNFKELEAAAPVIHMQILLSTFDVLARAWQIIDSTKDDNTMVAASYLALSTLSKISELSSVSTNKLLENYIKAKAQQEKEQRQESPRSRSREWV